MRHILLPLILTFFTLWGCREKKGQAADVPAGPPPALSVEAMIAEPKELSADIEVPGTILAFESTEIHPEAAGRLTSLNVREGTYVSKGALLAKLFDGDLQAQLRKLQVQLQIAEQTEKRQAELVKIQGISQQEYDLSLLQVHNLNADIDIIQQEIRKTEIRAPFSGQLGLRNVSPGAFVTPSTVITSISQVDKLKLQFNVPERYGSQLKNGMTVQFMIDGSTTTYEASVLASEMSIEEDTRSLAVRATVKRPDKKMIPGTFAKVKISLGESTNALMVPNSAVIPIGRKKQIYLYKNGKSEPVDIVTGLRDSTNLQVLEGLKEGDTVITSAILYLRSGSSVEISKIN